MVARLLTREAWHLDGPRAKVVYSWLVRKREDDRQGLNPHREEAAMPKKNRRKTARKKAALRKKQEKRRARAAR
jgi:protein involved in sex pheromone biosynthesis